LPAQAPSWQARGADTHPSTELAVKVGQVREPRTRGDLGDRKLRLVRDELIYHFTASSTQLELADSDSGGTRVTTFTKRW
jgi:hypothetical protein